MIEGRKKEIERERIKGQATVEKKIIGIQEILKRERDRVWEMRGGWKSDLKVNGSIGEEIILISCMQNHM